MPKTTKKFPLKASILACALMGAPLLANAAGIGKLTVLSALGQPLRAEIDLTASKDELSSLSAKLATQDQFRQQGMEFTAAVAALNFSIEKRANGQPYVRLTTDRPLNEPFLDILVELSWASGRLTREYTFLLDPVELPRPTGATVVTPGATPVSSAPAPVVTETSKPTKASKAARTTSTAKAEAAPKAEPVPKAEPAPTPKAEPAPAAKSEGGATREVKKGDTLGKIAAETAPEGVSLDQMLVALYSSNRDAFIGDNLNRLKTGKILNVPDREAAAAVSESEARKTVSMHAQNFNAYRKQLAEVAAAGTPAEAAPAQAASGKITPKVEDKAPAPTSGKDKLEVSKSEAAAKDTAGKDAAAKAAKAAAAAEEDRVAKEKALKEAEARVAALEKNVADLKKLNEVKSQALADAEKKALAAKTEAVKPAELPKPVEAPKPAEPVKVEEPKPVEPVAPAPEAAKPEPVAEAAPPATEPVAEKPAEVAPPPKKRALPPPPEPEPEPTFMEEFGNLVYTGLAGLLAIGGLFGFREYKRRKELESGNSGQFDEPSSTSSVFGTTGGQSVDTNNVSLASGFSQTSLTGNEGTAGVDPVAEAEVYMAYGRDAQAEEILLEAIKAEPTRQAVHLKLLELYAARKSVKPFEEVAKDLQQQTGGIGANWERAAALGKGIDPANPLYGSALGATDTQNMDAFGTSTVIMPPGQLAKMAAMDPAKADTVVLAAVEPPPAPAVEEEMPSFDLDLGDEPASISAPEPAPVTLDFDLDLGADVPQAASEPALDLEVPSISPAEAPAAPAMDIEFDMELPASTAESAPAPAAASSSVDFDFNLDTPASSAPAPGAIAPAVDFSDISLELDAPAPAAEPAAPAVAEVDNAEVSTKLELAQAYEEMGDIEGMRELLQEVLAEGSAAQQESARSKLAQHGF